MRDPSLKRKIKSILVNEFIKGRRQDDIMMASLYIKKKRKLQDFKTRHMRVTLLSI